MSTGVGIAGKGILFAGNDEESGVELAKALTRLGCVLFDIVRTATEAIESAESRPPDLFLTDIDLVGEADGIEAAQVIRKRFGSAIVYRSCLGNAATLDRAIASLPEQILFRKDVETRDFSLNRLASAISLALAAKEPKSVEGLMPAGEGIFLIEDEKIVALQMIIGLEKLGLDVAGHAMSAEEALEAIPIVRPRLVVSGINLCGTINGLEGLRQVRSVLDLPAIIVSGCIDVHTLSKAVGLGIDAYILKPQRLEELHCAIKLVIARASARNPPPSTDDLFADARRGSPDAVRKRLAEGADIHARDRLGWTALMHAALFNDDPAVQEILVAAGVDPAARDALGLCAADLASRNQGWLRFARKGR